MLIKVSRILSADQITAVEIMLFELGNNLKDVARVMSKATGLVCTAIQNEIAALFSVQIAKKKDDSKKSRTDRLIKDRENGNLKRRLREQELRENEVREQNKELRVRLSKREEKRRKLEDSIKAIEKAERRELIDSHKNKQLSKKWV